MKSREAGDAAYRSFLNGYASLRVRPGYMTLGIAEPAAMTATAALAPIVIVVVAAAALLAAIAVATAIVPALTRGAGMAFGLAKPAALVAAATTRLAAAAMIVAGEATLAAQLVAAAVIVVGQAGMGQYFSRHSGGVGTEALVRMLPKTHGHCNTTDAAIFVYRVRALRQPRTSSSA